MSAFTSRTSAYKAGVGLLIFMTLLYAVGFVAPYWATTEARTRYMNYSVDYRYHDGLWMLCIESDIILPGTGCWRYGISGFPDWFHVVRVMEGLCVSGLVIACLLVLATNCCRTFPGPRNRVIEILAGLSGIAGFIGCMVYVGMRLEKDADSDVSITDYVTLFLSLQWDFNWALYFAAFGSGLCVIAAIVIAVGNKPVGGSLHTASMVMTTVTAQPGYAPQPYVSGLNPGAPPEPYVAQPGYTPDKAGYPAPY